MLIPGGITGWLSWIPHQEVLQETHRVVRVQPIHNELGSAGQRGDPSYTWETAVESLRMTLDELGVETAHFAAWSAGGKSLLDFALTHSDRVRSMTLVEPAARWVLEQAGTMDPAPAGESDFLSSLFGREITDDDLAKMLVLAGFAVNESEARSDAFWERARPHRMTLSWLSERVLGSDKSLDDLAAIRCPVLLTKGTNSAATDRLIVDVLHEHLPDSTVIEYEGNHAHHIENLGTFIADLRRHMSLAG